MAECTRFSCSTCDNEIDSWSDGNPYFIDEQGAKVYAYHPNHEDLSRCIGNDHPFVCLNCGNQFVVDSNSPIEYCTSCGNNSTVPTSDLAGRTCWQCRDGKFEIDPDFHCIS